jgi:hypothetical protein
VCLETGWTLDYAGGLTLDWLRLMLDVAKRERARRLLESFQAADFPHLKRMDRVKLRDRLLAEAEPKDRPAMSIEDFIRARMRPDG